MKNIKLIITILAVALFAVSCETYDDYDTERTTVVGFTTLVGGPNAVVPAGGTLVKEVNVFVSDVSSSERSFNVVVDQEVTVIGSENYTFGTMTIPANERTGIFSVTFTDVNLTSDPQPFRLKFDNSTPDYISGNRITIQVRN